MNAYYIWAYRIDIEMLGQCLYRKLVYSEVSHLASQLVHLARLVNKPTYQ